MKHRGHSGSVLSATICKDAKVKMEAQDIPHITALARKSNLLKTGGVMADLDWHNDPSRWYYVRMGGSNKSQLFLMEHFGEKIMFSPYILLNLVGFFIL